MSTTDMAARLAALERQPAARVLVLLLGLAAGAAGLAWVVNSVSANAVWPELTDMGIYLRAAEAISHGNSPYSADPGDLYLYVYPPLFADVLALLASMLGDPATAVVWMSIAALSMVGAVALLTRNFGLRLPLHWIVFICGIVLLARSGRSEIYHGQVNFVLLLLLAAGFLFWRAQRLNAAALLWALMICVKPFLGVIVLFLLRQGDWRTAAKTFVLSGLIFFASFLPAYHDVVGAIFGWRETTQHFTTPEWSANLLNLSFYALFLRLFTANEFTQAWADLPILVFVGLAVVGAIAATAFVVATRRAGPADATGATDLLRMAAAIAAFMAIGPVTEGNHLYYLAPGLVAACALAARRWSERAGTRGWWLATAAAWALVMIGPLSPKHFDRADPRFLEGAGILLTGWTAYALLAAIVLTATVLSMERRASVWP